MIEQDKSIIQNVMPEVRVLDPLDRLTRILHALFDHLRAPGLSEHNRGGGPALDRALYGQTNNPQLTLWD